MYPETIFNVNNFLQAYFLQNVIIIVIIIMIMFVREVVGYSND